jgi:ATP diphosphatase
MGVLVVGLGPGDPESVPAASLRALGGAATVLTDGLPPGVLALLPVAHAVAPAPEALPDGARVAAIDTRAYAIALARPDAATLPARPALRARAIAAEVARLAGVGAHLRRECPWDREQTAGTIVPHTIEEAFEVAEAVAGGDPRHQRDELGDLLFQVVFLCGLLEEAGEGHLGDVARLQADKLVARHPHVYGDRPAGDAARVVDSWERAKREERADQGIFHDLPPGLPALALAGKTQKRAASVGFAFPDARAALAKLDEEVAELHADTAERELGDVVLAAVAVARAAGVDPEIAVRRAAARFRARVERAAELAAREGRPFDALTPDAQLRLYERAAGRG